MKNSSKEVSLDIALPGFQRKDIKVNLNDTGLVVVAQKKSSMKKKKKDFFHLESSSQTFTYRTTLPKIDSKKAKMTFSKGVLKIKAPKKK